jgi:hypothetical protein
MCVCVLAEKTKEKSWQQGQEKKVVAFSGAFCSPHVYTSWILTRFSQVSKPKGYQDSVPVIFYSRRANSHHLCHQQDSHAFHYRMGCHHMLWVPFRSRMRISGVTSTVFSLWGSSRYTGRKQEKKNKTKGKEFIPIISFLQNLCIWEFKAFHKLKLSIPPCEITAYYYTRPINWCNEVWKLVIGLSLQESPALWLPS